MTSKRQPKVFVVEDQEINHPLFKEVFEQAGFEVTIRKNAEGNFIDDVLASQPDIISMDLMIDGHAKSDEHDGFAAIEWLKADPRTADIPIIVLTNFFQEDGIRRAKEAGAVDYLILQGQSLSKVPEHHLRYLEDPSSYTPSHPIFREK